MNDPEALIADEPTANLDSERTREFMAIVGRLKGQGRTVILTSHDPLVYEADVVDRVIQLRDGQVDDDV
jgi:putative ABC transport system ATP-binding protein